LISICNSNILSKKWFKIRTIEKNIHEKVIFTDNFSKKCLKNYF
jgi:hypothetical protein